MTLKDIQDVSLDVLKEFHNFCVDNEISYSLGYGTLLGAVRHKGFIPWDDDIDVMMPRPDYDKFIKLYQDNEKYGCFAAERGNCLLAYARLVDCARTYVKTNAPWNNRDTGIWIDIFPIDGVENDEEEYLKNAKKTWSIWRKTIWARQALQKISFKFTFKKLVTLIVKKLLFANKIFKYRDQQLAIERKFDYDNSLFVSNLSILLYYKRSYFPKRIFERYSEIQFEGFQFKAILDYSAFLKSVYGDYMKLPPENKRRTHSFHNYYWR